MGNPSIAILVDSTANIPAQYVEQYNIHTMPLRVNWPGEEIESLKDLKEINPDDFYKRLKESKDIPTTSQPSPGEFIELFSKIGETSKDILAILVSDKLSGTFKSAQFALNMVEDLNIVLIDSKNGAMGMGLIALKAARLIESGLPLSEVTKLAREYVETTRSWFVVETLEFLHKGGRVSGTKRMIGTILDMKPLLHLVDGALELFGTVRTMTKAVNTMLDIVEVEVKNRKSLWMGISHAANPQLAEFADAEIRKRFNPELLITNQFSPVLGVHTGPGALGVAHLGDD